MVQDNSLSNRLDLIGNEWYDMQCPIVFFTYFDEYQKHKADYEKVKAFLTDRRTRKIDIGNIGYLKDGTTLGAHMFVNGYIMDLKFNKVNRNLVINRIYEASKDFSQKRYFVENPRKTVCVEKYGIIFSRRPADGHANIIEPLDRAEAMQRQFRTANADNMPAALFDELESYVATGRRDKSKASVKQEYDGTYFAEKYLDTVYHYANFEYEIEQEKTDSAYSLTYESRQSIKQEGDKSRKYVYEFICPDFDTDMYPQNSEVDVILKAEEGELPKRVRASILQIEDIGEGRKKIIVTFRDQFNESDLPESGGEIKRKANACQKNVRHTVVEQFKSGDVTAKYMLDAFNSPKGIVTKEFDNSMDIDAVMEEIRIRAGKYPPFKQQNEAIKAGIQAPDLALVLGPPGTGKTTVIVEWALYFMRQGKRVLISSKNNKAVDNAFERIAKKQKELPELKDCMIARLGNVDKVQENVKDYLIENQHEAIQNKIFSSTDGVSERLKNDISGIRAAKEKIVNMQGTLDKFFETQKLLWDNYYERLSFLSKKVLEAHKNIEHEQMWVEMQIKSLDELNEDIAEKRIYLELESRKNFFIKLFHYRENKHIQKQLEIQVEQATNTKIKDGSKLYIAEYNSASRELLSLIKAPELAEYKSIHREITSTLKKELDIKVSTAFYGEASYSFSEDRGELNGFLNTLDGLKNQVDNLQEIVNQWRDVVSDKTNMVLSDILIGSVSVVGATCIGINTNRQFNSFDFDVAIIDEAGQIQIHDAIVPMSRAKKTLMLGDHKQIPPSVDEEMIIRCRENNVDTTLLEQSFFQYIFEKGSLADKNRISLDTQFRMPKAVADILSNQFYDNKYASFEAKHKDDRSEECKRLFEKQLVLIDTSDCSRRFEEESRNSETMNVERCNPYEAQIVAKLLKMLNVGQENAVFGIDDIGVIAPLKKQKETMQNVVRKQLPALSKTEISTMIATLDSFQGQERELIIYSSTRSNKRNSIGFLNELRRLNVALSRCQKQLIIIGDFDFLTSCTDKNDSKQEYEAEYENPEIMDDYDYDDDYDDDDFYGYEEAEEEFIDEDKEYISPALDKSVKRFAEFMQYLLNEVKSGKGQYIKSKELGE